jgi:hypothetical protein
MDNEPEKILTAALAFTEKGILRSAAFSDLASSVGIRALRITLHNVLSQTDLLMEQIIREEARAKRDEKEVEQAE